jgi:hypothetical protein
MPTLVGICPLDEKLTKCDTLQHLELRVKLQNAMQSKKDRNFKNKDQTRLNEV